VSFTTYTPSAKGARLGRAGGLKITKAATAGGDSSSASATPTVLIDANENHVIDETDDRDQFPPLDREEQMDITTFVDPIFDEDNISKSRAVDDHFNDERIQDEAITQADINAIRTDSMANTKFCQFDQTCNEPVPANNELMFPDQLYFDIDQQTANNLPAGDNLYRGLSQSVPVYNIAIKSASQTAQ